MIHGNWRSVPETVFIGLDLGTGGVRGCAINGTEKTVAETSVGLPPNERRDPARLLSAASSVLSSLNRQTGGLCEGLSIAGTSGSLIGLDLNRRPVGEISLYCDKPTEKARTGIEQIMPRDTIGGASIDVITRLRTVAGQSGVSRIAFEADFVASVLAGADLPSDINNALKAGGDPVTCQWSPWLSELGLDLDKLPTLVEAGKPVARVNDGAARRLGFMKSPAILAGTTDGCAASLAAGLERVGDAVTSLGTTLTLKIFSEQPVCSLRHGIYSHRLLEKWLVGGASNAGGAILDALFGREKLGSLSATPINKAASTKGYVPLLVPGERFPIADPQLQPALLPRPGNDEDYFLAILDSLVAWEKRGYEVLEAAGAPKVQRLFTVGGGSRNDAWMVSRKRDLRCVHHNPMSVHPAFGAARLARSGILQDWNTGDNRRVG